MPGVERTKEEELVLALEASKDTGLEEQAAQATNVLFDDFSNSFTNP